MGAMGVGAISMIFFFVRQYFVNRDERQKETSSTVHGVELAMAGVVGRLDSIDTSLKNLNSSVHFITEKQMPQIFKFIDATPRATDLNHGSS